MKPNEKKSVPIEQEIWREMAQAKLDSGKDIYQLVSESWKFYKANADKPRVSTRQNTGEIPGPNVNQTALFGSKISEEATRIAELARQLADLTTKLDKSLAEKAIAKADRGVQEIPGALRPGRSGIRRGPEDPKGGKRKAG